MADLGALRLDTVDIRQLRVATTGAHDHGHQDQGLDKENAMSQETPEIPTMLGQDHRAAIIHLEMHVMTRDQRESDRRPQ